MSGCFSSRSQYRFLSQLMNLQRFFRRATPQFMGQEIYDSIQNEEIKMIWTVTDSEHTEIWLDHNQEYREKVQELLNFTK